MSSPCKKLCLIAISLLSSLLASAETAVVNGLTWSYRFVDDYDGGAEVTDVKPIPSGALEIPSQLNGHSVVSIGWGFLGECGTRISSVEIPNTVKRIWSWAFEGCKYLTTVRLPEGIEEIYDNAFVKCPLTSLELPSTLRYLGEGAFTRSNEGALFQRRKASGPSQSETAIMNILKHATGGLFMTKNKAGLPSSPRLRRRLSCRTVAWLWGGTLFWVACLSRKLPFRLR